MATNIFQQVLAGFTDTLNTTSAADSTSSVATPTSLATPASAATSTPADFNLAGIITLLFSFSALRDWLKLIVIGGFFETCRRWISWLYRTTIDRFFMNAYFDASDPSYNWMMVWLSKQPSWKQARDVEISTDNNGANNITVALEQPEESEESDSRSFRKLAYLPAVSRTYSFWYKRRWMTITRNQTQGQWGNKEITLNVSILTRSTTVLVDLLKEARSGYMSAQENKMGLYVADSSNDWRYVGSRSKRHMRSVVLDPGVKELILEDARDFMDSKDWYLERGIPYRRGYLLYGAPGSGKTSLIHCLAGELGLDVYIISLSRAGLDDAALDALINDLPEQCIALMEDVDAAFTHALNRETNTTTKGPSSDAPDGPSPSAPPSTSRLSLSGLLNALDGVGAQEGRILFATTNKYTALDPALCRPGRMDLHVEFTNASKYQARELFLRFYRPNDRSFDDEDKSEINTVASSSTPTTSTESTPSTSSTPNTAAMLVPDKPLVTGARHNGRAPKLTREQTEELAAQFADAVPEKEFSMASLQGYLMTYKIRPYEALKDVQEWIEKQRLDRAAKERSTKEKAERAAEERKEKEEKEAKEKKQQEETEATEKRDKDPKEKEQDALANTNES